MDHRKSGIVVEKQEVAPEAQRRLLERTRTDDATSDAVRDQLQELAELEGDGT